MVIDLDQISIVKKECLKKVVFLFEDSRNLATKLGEFLKNKEGKPHNHDHSNSTHTCLPFWAPSARGTDISQIRGAGFFLTP